jgi:hypothetical protein
MNVLFEQEIAIINGGPQQVHEMQQFSRVAALTEHDHDVRLIGVNLNHGRD